MSKAFEVPITNLSDILSNISEITTIIGTEDSISNFNNSFHKNYIISYKTDPSIIKKIFRYIVLNIKITCKFISLMDSFGTVIFFMETFPILPLLFSLLYQKKTCWFLPSQIPCVCKGFIQKIKLKFTFIGYIITPNIIIYSDKLISFWNLDKYQKKIIISHEHYLNFNKFNMKNSLSIRPLLVGYIGRLSEEKGILNFVEALPMLFNWDRQDIQIKIIGDGPLFENIEVSLNNHKITNRVEMAGWISHDQLPNILNNLRLIVVPSFTEGLPNIILEAMACGTPVLATTVGAIPDVIKDGKTGFLMKNNSPEEIVDNIIRVLDFSDLQGIVDNARRYTEENFSFERTVEHWRWVLQDIM